MKNLLSLLMCGLLLFGCSKEYDDSEIKKRLDNLENTRIPSIESQVAAIQTSLPLLRQTDEEIKGYITTLQGKVGKLEQSMSDVDVKIKALEYTLQTDFSQRLADIVSQLNAHKQEIQNKIDSFDSSVKSLQTANAELDKKISYLDGKIDMQKDWITATFATLTQYNGLVADIATIRTNIETINKNIADLETRITEKIATDIATAVSGLQEEIQQKVTEITDAYTAAIGTAKNEITAAYTSAISSAIDNCIASMKDWVNEKLANYYNIAAIDAKVQLLQNAIADGDKKLDDAIKEKATLLKEALEQAIADGDTALQEKLTEEIEQLENKIDENYETLSKEISEETARLQGEINATNTALETAKTEITDAYTSAITTAIEANNGLIDKKVADEIATVNNRIDAEIETLDNKISAIETRLDALEQEINDKILALDGRVSDLETDVAALLKRIQSISYIPRYSDGQAVMNKLINENEGIAEFDFVISPKDAVIDLDKVWDKTITMKAVYTQTRAISLIDLAIIEFSTDTEDGIVSLKVSGANLNEDFFLSNMSASAALFISDGNNSVISDFIQMRANCNNAIFYTTSDNKSVSADLTLLSDFVSNTYENGHGLIVSKNDITAIKNETFFNCKNLISITIPDSVISIEEPFIYCDELTNFYGKFSSKDNRCLIVNKQLISFAPAGLTQYTIPNNVISIGRKAFAYRNKLENIIIPQHVISIGQNAFQDCTNLETIMVPDNVTLIEVGAFAECEKLAVATIGKSIVSIGTAAFSGCSYLQYIDCKAIRPPALGDNVFWGTLLQPQIRVPQEAVEAYKVANGWSKYADRIIGYDFE